ncbi:unnamed protein product, partial [Laminaria digitata]
PSSSFCLFVHTGQCLSGGAFKRCGVDTLWYVTGTNTQYQLHHRPLEDGQEVSE